MKKLFPWTVFGLCGICLIATYATLPEADTPPAQLHLASSLFELEAPAAGNHAASTQEPSPSVFTQEKPLPGSASSLRASAIAETSVQTGLEH